MGGHGGLNILPQKSWHVYNQDNREKVARDEAAHEEVQKAKRAKHQKAESEYRHAIMLARVRGDPQDVDPPRIESPSDSPPQQLSGFPDRSQGQQHAGGRQPDHSQQRQQQQQQHDAQETSATQLEVPAPGRGELLVSSHAKQRDNGHMNFWKEDEVQAGNAEVKVDQLNERRRRGDAATQTSDARFDERFQLGHAMHGRAHTPWYAASAAHAAHAVPTTPSFRPADGAALLAAAAHPSAAAPQQDCTDSNPVDSNHKQPFANSPGKEISSKKGKDRQKEKDRKKQKKKRHKERPRNNSLADNKKNQSDTKLRLNAAQLKASVKAMREERVARETQERLRQQNFLRQNLRK